MDVPSEVKKVILEHLDEVVEISDEEPDEQMLEVLEDLYVKAGEIGEYFSRMGGKKRKKIYFYSNKFLLPYRRVPSHDHRCGRHRRP